MPNRYTDLIAITDEYIAINDSEGVLPNHPEGYFENIESIDTLNINNWKHETLPDTLNKIKVLKGARIYKSKLKKLPPCILNDKIEALQIITGQIRIGDEVAAMTSLKILEVDSFYGKKWPESFSRIPNLEVLKINSSIGKKLSHLSIIKGISKMKQLKSVHLSFRLNMAEIKDAIKGLNFLEGFNFWMYNQSEDDKYFSLLTKPKFLNSSKEAARFTEYQEAVKGHNLNEKQLVDVFSITNGYTKGIGNITEETLRPIYDEGKLTDVFFTYRPGNKFMSNCKESLSNINFSYSKEAESSIYVIGTKTKLPDLIKTISENKPYITEDHIKDLIEHVTNPWLVNTEDEETNTQLYNLLISDQVENKLLALQIIEGGGANKEILSMMAVLMLAHPDKKVAKLSEKLFKKYGATSTYESLKSSKISLRRSGSSVTKINALFKEKSSLHDVIFRLYHGLIAGNNPNIKDVNPSILSFKDYKFQNAIPGMIKYFENITNISFVGTSEFQINESIPHLHNLNKLAHLDFSKTKYHFDATVQFPPTLLELDLSTCTLEDPNILSHLSQLHSLNVSGSLITDWSFLEHLPNLKNLIASRNKLSEIPKGILDHKKISEIDLSYNKLSHCDALLDNYCTYLNLNNNKLENLNPKIFDIQGLDTLLLRGNKLTSVFTESIPFNGTRYLRTLDLSNNAIEEFTIQQDQLNTLRTLNISKNKLSVLHPSIFLKTQISNLDISHNEITSIPKEITTRSPYNRLNFSRNNIEVLESYVNDIRAQHFDLKYNKIHTISPTFKRIPGDLSRVYWSMRNNPINAYF